MVESRAVGRCRWAESTAARKGRRLALGARGVIAAGLLAACGSNDVGGGAGPVGEPATLRLNGAVQKGPFIVGSSIRVANLDLDTNPTGLVFYASTRDDQGQFELELPASDIVSIEGTGFYYNEVTGSLSQSPLSLKALYAIGSGRADDAFVNVITHLTYERVQGLIVGGLSYDDARVQAEQELLVGLGLMPPGFTVGHAGAELNVLGGDTNDNAYLLALSSILVQSALLVSPGSVDASLQELLNQIALELADTGAVDVAHGPQLAAALTSLDSAAIEAAFAVRFPSAVVPDLDRVLDQDGDGLVNTADDCPKAFNPLQEDVDLDGRGDACDLDLDGDGTPDASDASPNDPNEWTDADGVADASDNCLSLDNPLQEDIDLDGLGDACDADRDGDGTPDASDAAPSDPNEWTDADGVADATDNCLSLDNADQLDADLDGVGDACDPDAPTCNAQTEGQLQCNEQNVEVCSSGSWATLQTCDFWCTSGACNTCKPGATFCDIPGGSTPVTVWVCDANAVLRKFVSASTLQTCFPPDYPSNTSTLPVDTNPPRWVRVSGSR